MGNNNQISEEEYNKLADLAFKINETAYSDINLRRELIKLDGYKRNALYKIMIYINKDIAKKIYTYNRKIDKKMLIRFKKAIYNTTAKEKTLKKDLITIDIP